MNTFQTLNINDQNNKKELKSKTTFKEIALLKLDKWIHSPILVAA